MSQKVENLHGWYALHDFRSMNWAAFRALDSAERREIQGELDAVIAQFENYDEKREGSFGFYEVLGHKADFMFMHLHPDFHKLNQFERELDGTRFGSFLSKTYSYVSIVELSNYVHSAGEDPYQNDHVKKRLYPELPKTKHVCFYPMNKKREGADNWYMLSFEERRELMRSHGMTGRKFAGKVTQMISGSTGLDEWEWGVTLFADEPLVFKDVVYAMRFDEVSARYGEFGDFYVGNRLSRGDLKMSLLSSRTPAYAEGSP